MRKLLTFWLSVSILFVFSKTAVSHELTPEEAGHPVRLAAYALHPIGFVLYHGILKPAHGLVSKPGLKEVFGHQEGEMGGKSWERYRYHAPALMEHPSSESAGPACLERATVSHRQGTRACDAPLHGTPMGNGAESMKEEQND